MLGERESTRGKEEHEAETVNLHRPAYERQRSNSTTCQLYRAEQAQTNSSTCHLYPAGAARMATINFTNFVNFAQSLRREWQ